MSFGLFRSSASQLQDEAMRRSANDSEPFLRDLIQTTNDHYQNIDASIIKLRTSNQLIAELNERIAAEEQRQALAAPASLELAQWQELKTDLSASICLLQQSLTDAMRALEELIGIFKAKNYHIELQAIYKSCPKLNAYLEDYHESMY